MIYFDYSATTPMSDAALKTYEHVARKFFANSRSLHSFGEESETVLNLSRKKIAQSLGVEADEIYFTGSGSEATFLALTGLALAHQHKGRTIVTTQGEHHSVHQALFYLQRLGFSIRYVPVNEFGEVTIDNLSTTIDDDTILVTIAHANSEIGTVQNIAEIGRFLARQNILFHSDCVQTFGKLPIPSEHLSSLTVSAHKCYGPKGVGAAYIQRELPWVPFLQGTTHENGFRPGTVDVPAIASFAAAIDEWLPQAKDEMIRLGKLRARFISAFQAEERVVFEGHPTNRLPFHTGLRVKGIEGQLLMLEFNRKGIAISTGSACSVGESTPPKTLISIGRSEEEAHEFVRITFGRWTTEEEVDVLIEAFHEILSTIKR